MIRRFYAEKRQGFDREATRFLREIAEVLGIKTVKNVRILYRYDVESGKSLPVLETLTDAETKAGVHADLSGARIFATEPKAGEFDAAAMALKVQLALSEEQPFAIRSAKIYALFGQLSEEEYAAIKRYALGEKGEEASLALPFTLRREYPAPQEVECVFGFRDLDMGGMDALIKKYQLDISAVDLLSLKEYFKAEYRDPTAAELALFAALAREGEGLLHTQIGGAELKDAAMERAYGEYLSAREELGDKEPVSLHSIASTPCRLLQRRGALEGLKRFGVTQAVEVRGSGEEAWAFTLSEELAFPESTYAAFKLHLTQDPHNMPGEKRRAYLEARYKEAEELLSCKVSAAGVSAIFHEGYKDRPRTFSAYLAAAPVSHIKYEKPAPGDALILVGGADPLAGERLRRLFEREEFSSLIKCLRPVGAEGIALAAASLADGIDLDLGLVPAKNEGVDAVGRALSCYGRRIAVVVKAREAENAALLAGEEGLEGTAVATVTEVPRLVLRHEGKIVVNLSHEVLSAGGSVRRVDVSCDAPAEFRRSLPVDFTAGMRAAAADGNLCSRKGLVELYDDTVGGKCLFPSFGGKLALTPPQAAVYRAFPGKGVTYTAWGGNAEIAEKSAYHAAYFAIVESVSKLIAAGADFKDIYLSLHRTLPREKGGAPLGKALAAFLGAYKAECDLGVAALGENVSVTGADVPPATYCVATATGFEREAIAPAFKGAGHKVVLLAPAYDESGLPVPHSLIKNFKIVTALMRADKVLSAFALGSGGAAEGVLKCCLGNEIGFRFTDMVPMETVFGYNYGAFILELNDETAVGEELGRTTLSETVARGLDLVPLVVLRELFEGKLAPVWGRAATGGGAVENFTSFKKYALAPRLSAEKPRVLLPVFAGMKGAEEAKGIFEGAGAEAELLAVQTRMQSAPALKELARRIEKCGVFFLADGIRGDHVCGLGKYIAACLTNEDVKNALEGLLERGGLIGGVGLGFEALLRVGLLPFGKFTLPDETCPRIFSPACGESITGQVRLRVSCACSPWLAGMSAGDIFTLSARLGGGLVCSEEMLTSLAENGQIAAQFVDFDGNASTDARFDPCGSSYAVDGLLSPDGKIIGSLSGFFLCGRQKQAF